MADFTLTNSATDFCYDGTDLDEWMAHFSFSAEMKEWFVEIGVMELSDIAEVYMAADLMEEAESKLNMIDFRRFKDAATKTKMFIGMPFAMPPTVAGTYV